jgi:hypothetical protein
MKEEKQQSTMKANFAQQKRNSRISADESGLKLKETNKFKNRKHYW